jgi:putative membrane protein
VSVPPLVFCVVAAGLYALGGRGRRRWKQEACFYAAIATLFVVLEPPFDDWADTSFAMHMVQHVFLLTVVPPLLALGRPWPRVWMPFPAGARRSVARGLALGRSTAPLRIAGRTLTRPPVAVAVLAAVLVAWHIPSFYGAAVENEGVHLLEHATFIGAALLFWGPLLGAPPVRARIDHLRRCGWFVAASVPGWIIAIVLAYASHPLYPVYASLPHRAFGLTPTGDQELAAGIMWVPGSLAYLVAAVLSFYRWLEPAATNAPSAEPRPEELSWT